MPVFTWWVVKQEIQPPFLYFSEVVILSSWLALQDTDFMVCNFLTN
jgi:hypothetical protein